MEIKYEKLSKWNYKGRALNNWTDEEHNFIMSNKIESYLDGAIVNLNPKEGQTLNQIMTKFSDLFDTMELLGEIKEEIDLNITNIPGPDQVSKYLSYIKKEIGFTLAILDESLHFDRLEESKTNYRDYKNGSATHSDNLSVLFRTFERIKASYENIIEYIEDLLNPDQIEESLIMENELSAVNHRIVLLHRLGIFETLFKEHFNILGPENFAKLIANIIGAQNKSLRSVAGEVGKLIKEIDHPNLKKTVQTDKANNKINMFLVEIGLYNMI